MTSKEDKNLDLISSLQQKKIVNEEKKVNRYNIILFKTIGKRR